MSRNLARPSNRQLTIISLSLLVGLSVSAGSDAALSATTANTIKGTAPLFVTTGANAVDLTDFKFFGLHYNGTDYYTPLQLGAALDAAGANGGTTKPSDLYGSATPTYPLTLALGTPLSTEINDVDGDGANPAPVTEKSTGTVKLGWYYGAGAGTQLSAADLNQSFCVLAAANKSPYLKITGDIKLNTTYGDPNSQPYPDATLGLTTTPIRKFSIPLSGGVCGALPDKTYNTAKYIGAPEWDTTLGFLPQPVGSDNFPTTGANGLYFDLIIGGADATTLDWPGYPTATPVIPALTDKGITVTVTNVTSNNVTVKLTGPVASSYAAGATAPAFGGSPTTPASFIVRGFQGATPVINYSFNIKRWYVNRGTIRRAVTSAAVGADTQTNWCNNLSGPDYVLSGVRDLTNSNVGPAASFPLAGHNGYQRRIGGGLFTEWGDMFKYTGANFGGNFDYWTSDFNGPLVYHIQSNNGRVSTSVISQNHFVACASRP